MSQAAVKFLLVDDVEENLVALEALLRRDGLELLKAHSGAEALELLLIHDVALALLDVQMPEMDGFELAELMRGMERTRRVPIIFLTAGARDPLRVFQGYEAGAVDFLFKPLDPHVLASKADVFFQLQQQKSEIAENLRMNEVFVGILGHDLRNPLGSIVAGAQLLQTQVTEEKQRRTLGRILSSAGRMKDMIGQLFDLTRARLGGGVGLIGHRMPVDVGILVSRVVDEQVATAPERQVTVKVTGNASTSGDATRLLQVFSNLISNAVRHGEPQTPVTVTIDGTADAIEVVVRNQGAIPAVLLPRIFDPFRGERPTNVAEGLGLGLFISKQIVAGHGGNIAVESTPELGTAFTVRLPRKAAVTRALAPGPSRRILIVDDDGDWRETLEDAFESEGYEVATAADGQEALETLTNGGPRPDLVILDLNMPVMDGNRVYRAMQSDVTLAAIPVLVATSSPQSAPAGVAVIEKPLPLDGLFKIVTEICERRAR